MKIFITGICGFVGSALARWFRQHDPQATIAGMDSFIRPGSETNRPILKALGIEVRQGDIRNPGDFDGLPAPDWVIDAAAQPSVLAGLDGRTGPRELIEHNLFGTANVLEFCRQTKAGLILLSTSRVYSIPALASLPLAVRDKAFTLNGSLPAGVSAHGIGIDFPTTAPLSLYGSTKLASEILALEYGETFSFPVWINRCGVLAGGGQFGTAEQGIFSYWIHAYANKRPLKYCGFDGQGHQVRDAFHPDDLAELVHRQMNCTAKTTPRLINVGGGPGNAMSLAQLSQWCTKRFGEHPITKDPTPRRFDIPWMIMDNQLAATHHHWQPARNLDSILTEIADHAIHHPRWLELTGAVSAS